MPASATAASKPAPSAPRAAFAGGKPAKAAPAPQPAAAKTTAPAKPSALPAFARPSSATAPPAGALHTANITTTVKLAPPASSIHRAPHQSATSKPPPRLAPLASSNVPGATAGNPLAPHVREAIENTLHVDLGSVRLHSDAVAQDKAQSLSARAFTFANHIFLGKGEHPADLALISHEAAHVVQQQSGAHVQAWSSNRSDRYEREADQAASAVSRNQTFAVRERVDSPRVQRLGISDALDYFADKAYNIPGFRMFTIVLGVNPINMEHVDRSAANVLRAVVEFIPGGHLITQALDKYSVFDKVGDWVQKQLDTLAMTGSAIKDALMDFLHSLSWRDIFHLGRVWDRAKRIFTDPIDRIKDFVVGFVEGIWKFVRDAILKPIAALASKTAGWDLLCAVLGRNPITGEAVPQTAENLIGGFMKLIHEEEVWNNIQKAKAIPRAFAWFKGVLSGLLGFVTQIPGLFIKALKSLSWTDVIDLPAGFIKVAGVFGKFLVNFISWAGQKVWDLLQIIFEVVAPAVMPYLKKLGAAFRAVLKNPIHFMRNLIAAGKLGFEQFVAKIGAHLKAAFIEWLTGSLPGVYIPKALDLHEILKFVLSVLGLTWQNIRAKLVKLVGEPTVKAMETGFDIVVTLVKEGPAAAWEKIKDELSNLKEMVMQAVMNFVIETIVKKAVAKIVSLFVPGGAFIQAIISIYDTVMVFVHKLAKIIQVVKSFLDSFMLIANGAIGVAANKVESTLAGLLVLAINFLAGFLGLGKIADKVMDVINTRIRDPIDKALDSFVKWVATMAKKLWKGAKQAAGKVLDWLKVRVGVKADEESHELFFSSAAAGPDVMIASEPMPLEAFLDAKNAEAGKEQKQTISAIRKQLQSVKKLIAAGRPGTEDEKLQKRIEDEMNALGPMLVSLLSEGSIGTEVNPAPLDYEKRRSASYPVFYLATGTMKNLDQDAMKQKYPGNPPKNGIWRYFPNSKQDSPGGEEKFGLDESSQVEVGRKIEFDEKGKRGGGVPAFRNLVVKYGFRPSDYGFDIDHVLELQIGGEDKPGNLWPLPSGENRSSGSIIKNAEIKNAEITKTGLKFAQGKSATVADAFAAMKKKGKALWLIVTKTHQR
jgi:hypothetical protein